MLLGAGTKDGDVGELLRCPLQEAGLSAARFEEDELEVRAFGGERNPGRATAGADVDDRAVAEEG